MYSKCFAHLVISSPPECLPFQTAIGAVALKVGSMGTATSVLPWNLLEMQIFLPLLSHTDCLEAWDLIVVRVLGSSPGDVLNSRASC